MPEGGEGVPGWRLLRRLLPAWYRDRYGGEMVRLHRERARRRGTQAWRAWLGLVGDVVWTAAELRLAAGEGRGARPWGDSGWGERTMTTMTDGLASLRLAARSLLRRPTLTLASVATLGVGIGVTVAVADVVYTVLAAPLPYEDPDELVQLVLERGGRTRSLAPPARVRALREASPDGLILGVAGLRDLSLRGDPFPERVRGVVVGGSTLPMLGVQPLLGRLPDPEADRAGGPCVAVLSHGLWSERFGADPGVVGETISLDGRPCTMTGVMPRDFAFPGPYFAPGRLWVLAGPAGVDWSREEGPGFLVFGRRDAAIPHPVLDAMLERVPSAAGGEDRWTAVEWAASSRAASERRLLLILVASGLVLALAGLNFTALQLSRAEDRRAEVATRLALGAGRGRLLALVGSEAALLAAAGAASGCGVAWGMTELVLRLRSFFIPRMEEVAFGPDSMAACLGLGVLVGLLGSVVPAGRILRESARPPGGTGRGRHTSGRRGRALGRGLVALEATLALVLLSGSVLLLQSYRDLFAMDPGFPTEGLLHARVTPAGEGYRDPAARADLFARMEERLAAVPGIRSVGLAFVPPGIGGGTPTRFAFVGDEAGPTSPVASWQPVSPRWFETLGVSLVQGRGTAGEGADVREVVVNETLARRFSAGEPVVGRTLRRVPDGGSGEVAGESTDEPWVVVGVVADVREAFVHAPVPPAVYASMAAEPPSSVAVLARTEGAPMELADPLRRAVAEVEPGQPVYALRPLDFLLESEFDLNRLGLTLLGIFAAVAVILTGAGIYGVAAHSVGRRRREMGIRRALGARSESVRWMVVRDTGLAAALGGLAGLVAVGAFGDALRVLTPAWVGVRPMAVALAALWVALIVLAASWIPARRAAEADPVEALREE